MINFYFLNSKQFISLCQCEIVFQSGFSTDDMKRKADKTPYIDTNQITVIDWSQTFSEYTENDKKKSVHYDPFTILLHLKLESF